MNLNIFVPGGIALYGLSHYLGWFLLSVLGGRSTNAAAPFINLLSASLAAALLLSVAALVVLSGPIIVHGRRGAIGSAYLLMLPLAVIGIVVGAISGSPLLYLMSDTLYLCILFFAYLISRHLCLSNQESDWSSLQRTLRATVMVIAIVSAVFALLGRNAPPLYVTLLIAALSIELAWAPGWLFTALLATSILIQLPALNRATLVQLMVAFLFITFVRRHKLAKTWLRLLPLALFIIIGLSFIDLQNTRLSRRLAEAAVFVSGEGQPSGQIAILQRFFEAKAVIETVGAGNTLHMILGFGSGATIDMSYSADTAVKGAALMGADKVHNIHILPFAFYYRHGILGLALIGLLSLRSVRSLRSTLKSPSILATKPHLCLAALVLVLSLVNGFFASSHFITSFYLPFFAAILDAASLRVPDLSKKTEAIPV